MTKREITIGHPPILLGIGWGIVATWWVGLLLGVPLAGVARAGSRSKRSIGSLVRPVVGLLAVMAMMAIVAGVLGWLLAKSGGGVPGGIAGTSDSGRSPCAFSERGLGALDELSHRFYRRRCRHDPGVAATGADGDE